MQFGVGASSRRHSVSAADETETASIEKGRALSDAAFRIVVVKGARLRADSAGSKNPVRGTLHGMTMRHWITSFA